VIDSTTLDLAAMAATSVAGAQTILNDPNRIFLR
jgi:hypothetical protein